MKFSSNSFSLNIGISDNEEALVITSYHGDLTDNEEALVITSNESDSVGDTSPFSTGEFYSVDRDLYLAFNKIEVEELTAALNKKLLKKLKISNLKAIDPVGKLELDIERQKAELGSARQEIKRMHKIINKAKDALNEAKKH